MRVNLLMLLLLFTLNYFGQKSKNYFVIKPPQTDSLAILKLGGQAPFQYQFTLGFNFTKRLRLGFGLGVLDGPEAAMMNMYARIGDRTENQIKVLEDTEWSGSTSHLSAALTMNKFYWKFDLENVKFESTFIPIFYMENDKTSFESVFPDGTLTASTRIDMIPSQTYFASYIGTSLFNITKSFYVVGEIGIKKLINSNYRFTFSREVYQSLDELEKTYYDNLSAQMKANFSVSAFIPVINVYLVYKLKTCDCENY